jgi:exodeoxyribonuclease VII large subunit
MAKVFSVSELNQAIKGVIEPPFRGVSVKGEVSNGKLQSSGHFYFSLKDASSQLSAVLFRAQAAGLSRMPKEGDQIVAMGEVSLYSPRGQYQLVVRSLTFAGAGELLLQLQQRKEELQRLGFFDPARKKKLPTIPRRIGVVTSPTGAVIQDILNVLERRFPGFHLLLYPVKVQGEGAAEEIALAIDEMNRHRLADVLIVGRGGGSIEDLWAFNERCVAEAIFRSTIPIISAVGHETDFTIADWVADVRAPTPSAAAEMAIVEKRALTQFLTQSAQAIRQRVVEKHATLKMRLKGILRHPFFNSPKAPLQTYAQRLDDLREGIEGAMQRKVGLHQGALLAAHKQLRALSPQAKLQHYRTLLAPYRSRLTTAIEAQLGRKKERLAAAHNLIASTHPRRLLKRGYAILFQENSRSVIVSTKQLKPSQTVTAQLADGQIALRVEEMSPHVL